MFDEVADFEIEVNYSLRRQNGKPAFLDDKRELFDKMIAAGVPATEHIPHQSFWPMAKRLVKNYESEIDSLAEAEKGVCKDCTA